MSFRVACSAIINFSFQYFALVVLAWMNEILVGLLTYGYIEEVRSDLSGSLVSPFQRFYHVEEKFSEHVDFIQSRVSLIELCKCIFSFGLTSHEAARGGGLCFLSKTIQTTFSTSAKIEIRAFKGLLPIFSLRTFLNFFVLFTGKNPFVPLPPHTIPFPIF